MSQVKRFVPLLDRVLVKRVIAEARTAGGVLLPESAQPRQNVAQVVSIGPGGRSKDGNVVPISVKPGDEVLLPEFGGTNVKFDGEEYTLYRNDDILGVMGK